MLRYTKENSWEYESNNEVVYSLYEGHTLDGKFTSDMLFIMLDGYSDYDIYSKLVGWMYGAGFVLHPAYKEEYENEIKDIVDKWERENMDIIEKIKQKKLEEI